MKNLCKNCSKNTNGICEVFQLFLDDEMHNCEHHDMYVNELSIEEHIGYDMEVWEEEDEESKTSRQ